ncbi:IclR family transcriptional regulator [Thermobacillus xylanilyticus]|uniref:IclR family transcriptional regulator n=1 Tax=Thermobacillus xylanilyticus TaxID=76633 RepID=A0ABM8V0Z9_THEXY|nr:IclR family transcriptional regulator [Thermobacillus xylanilyticus]CAG5080066.1 IclR family transcriptional regulator [Thermobacillus xylanilyticus]
MPIIQALDRALRILDLFDEHTPELKLTEISARMQLHKSTAHALLRTLQIHGYIEQDEESGKYRLGLRLLEKGQMLLQNLDIRNVARPHLQALSDATGQTAHLLILDGREGVYIDKVEGAQAAIRYSRIGRRVPLHSSASGKVLAAFQPPDALERLLAGYTYVRHTPNTIDSEAKFRRELEEVRKHGCAFDREENEPGVLCIAAPIFGHDGQLLAAMSLSCMTARVDEAEAQRLAERVRKTTAEISARLGHR